MMWSETEWLNAAKGEAMAMADNAPPLQQGDYVAWTIQGDFGHTQGISAKHMAFGDLVTMCGQIIPPRHQRLAVVYRTLPLCVDCSLKYSRVHGGLGA